MMTEIDLKRTSNNGDATLGALYVNNVFFCYTLEDEPREVKVSGETRIPAGRYELERTFESGLLSRMQAAWFDGDWIPTIKNVPGFTYIRIHPGNTDDHTDGCPLVGFTADADNYTIGKSRDAFRALHKRLALAFRDGEVWINIRNELGER
jgi:hypothetical protein